MTDSLTGKEVIDRMMTTEMTMRQDRYVKRGAWKKACAEDSFTKRTIRRRKVRDANDNLVQLPNGKQKYKLVQPPEVREFIQARSRAVYMIIAKKILLDEEQLADIRGGAFSWDTMTPENIEGVYNKPFTSGFFCGEGDWALPPLAMHKGSRIYSTTLKRIFICRKIMEAEKAASTKRRWALTAAAAAATAAATACTIA